MREYSKLGGYLSPPVGIKLSEGRTVWSLSEVPLANWLQNVALCGLKGAEM